jgi:hypothetical protein
MLWARACLVYLIGGRALARENGPWLARPGTCWKKSRRAPLLLRARHTHHPLFPSSFLFSAPFITGASILPFPDTLSFREARGVFPPPSPPNMFGAFRRCPATLSRSLSSAAAASRALRLPLTRTPTTLRIPATRLANASFAGFHHSAKWQQVAAQEQTDANEAAHGEGLVTEFQELADRGIVHPNIINTITKQMRIKTMTDVQTRTINEALSGVDV